MKSWDSLPAFFRSAYINAFPSLQSIILLKVLYENNI